MKIADYHRHRLPHTRGDEPDESGRLLSDPHGLPHTRGDEPDSVSAMEAVAAASAPHAWG